MGKSSDCNVMLVSTLSCFLKKKKKKSKIAFFSAQPYIVSYVLQLQSELNSWFWRLEVHVLTSSPKSHFCCCKFQLIALFTVQVSNKEQNWLYSFSYNYGCSHIC